MKNDIKSLMTHKPSEFVKALTAKLNEKKQEMILIKTKKLDESMLDYRQKMTDETPGNSAMIDYFTQDLDLNGSDDDSLEYGVSDDDDDDYEYDGLDEEVINELSKHTLGSYIKKASSSAAVHGHKSGVADKSGNYAAGNHHGNKASKRMKGITHAVGKLTKEDAVEAEDDNVDELNDKMDSTKGPSTYQESKKKSSSRVR